MINRNEELQKKRQGSSPRVVIPPKQTSRGSEILANDTLIFDEASVSYNDLVDVPTTFPPSAHTHSYLDLTNLPYIPSESFIIAMSIALG
jgi:hypothetical protein